MIRKLIVSASVALGLLVLLLWPVSQLGVVYQRSDYASTTTLGLADGTFVYLRNYNRATAPDIRPTSYQVYAHNNRVRGLPASGFIRWPSIESKPGSNVLTVVVPLWCVFSASFFTAIAAYGVPFLRSDRRRRRGLCLTCGYNLTGISTRCPECNSPVKRSAVPRWPHAITPSRADCTALATRVLATLFLFLTALGLGLWAVEGQRVRAVEYGKLRTLDYTYYVQQTAPRLTGNIVSVGPNGAFSDLESAWSSIVPGTLVLLEPGIYSLPRRARLEDVALVGAGRGDTTIFAQRSNCIEGARRVRIEAMTLDCNDTPLFDVRQNGSVWFEDCLFFNYNSGAGGSNAIFASGSILTVTDCTFEGKSGRASASMAGNAFDLRGECRLFVRDTEFTDNSEIVRSCPSVFDRCRSTSSYQWAHGISIRSRPVYIRDNKATMQNANQATPFTLATDDPEFISALMEDQPALDDLSARMADRLGLASDARYWIALLRHADPKIRDLAAERIEELTGQAVRLSPPKQIRPIEELLRDLIESNSSDTRRAALLELLSSLHTAQPTLEALRDSGTPKQRVIAHETLRLMELDVPLVVELEYARLMNWLDSQ